MVAMIPRAQQSSNSYQRVSPGMYRDRTGRVVTQSQMQNAMRQTTANTNQQATNANANQQTANTTQQSATTNNAAQTQARQFGANDYARVGPGQWRRRDGKIVSSAQNPGRAVKAVAPTTQAPVNTTPTPFAGQSSTSQDATQAVSTADQGSDQQAAYRTFRDFLPNDVTSSPEYQWRLQQKQKALDAKLASLGLSNSGQAIGQELGLVQDLTGDEIKRQTDLATGEADRYERVQENQASRNERTGTEQFNRMMELLKLMQNQNPLDNAYSATNSLAGLYGNQGQYDANVARDQYGRIIGGNGTMAPVYNAPFADRPDYSQVEQYRAGARQQNAQDIMNLGSQLLAFL